MTVANTRVPAQHFHLSWKEYFGSAARIENSSDYLLGDSHSMSSSCPSPIGDRIDRLWTLTSLWSWVASWSLQTQVSIALSNTLSNYIRLFALGQNWQKLICEVNGSSPFDQFSTGFKVTILSGYIQQSSTVLHAQKYWNLTNIVGNIAGCNLRTHFPTN